MKVDLKINDGLYYRLEHEYIIRYITIWRVTDKAENLEERTTQREEEL